MAEQSVAVEYRLVPGFPLYKVGSDGTVWTLNRKFCKVPSTEWLQMKCKTQSRGYKQVRLHRKDGGATALRFVHRLVLELFVGPCPEGMEACHFPNPDKTCNRLDNLRWDTSEANYADSRLQGLQATGLIGRNLVKLSDEIAKSIRCEFTDPQITIDVLAEKHGVTPSNVAAILRGKTWKHVAGPRFNNLRNRYRKCA